MSGSQAEPAGRDTGPGPQVRLLVDTDIGGDFDDVNALALLAGLADVDLVTVTTVGSGGSALRRAKVASSLLMAAGRGSVPVYAGFDMPLRPNSALEALSPEHVLNAYEAPMASSPVQGGHAVDAILAAAARHGSALNILCLGALTNVAAAISKDEALMRQVGRVVVMGGAYRSQWREANIAIDPEAAAIVLSSGLPLSAIGFEEASRSSVPLARYREAAAAGTALGMLLARLAQRYSAAYHTQRVILCDVAAAALAVRPHLFTLRQVTVGVELAGTLTRGMTVVHVEDPFNLVAGAAPLSIVTEHDSAAVLVMFEELVLAQRPNGGGVATNPVEGREGPA